MIEKISQNWKSISGLAIAAVFVGTLASGGPMEALAGAMIPSPPPDTCTGGLTLAHFDKIWFTPALWMIHPTDPTTFPPLSPFLTYDIKVQDFPNQIKFIESDVAAFVGALGYQASGVPGAAGIPHPTQFFVLNVLYSTECI